MSAASGEKKIPPGGTGHPHVTAAKIKLSHSHFLLPEKVFFEFLKNKKK